MRLFRRGGRAPAGLCAIQPGPGGATLVHLAGSHASGGLDAGPPRVRIWETAAGPTPPETGAELARIVRSERLGGASCIAVLPPERYSLRLVRAPDVEPDELPAACRWLVKDLVDFSVEDAAVDYFEVPQERAGERAVYVVAARREVARDVAGIVDAAGLRLTGIDVAEVAVRHLAGRLATGPEGIALLQLGRRGGTLAVCREGLLHMVRRLETRLDQVVAASAALREDAEPILASEAESLDALLLEVQRSLDYYESALAQPPVASLWLAPLEESAPELPAFLEKRLTPQVRALDLSDLVGFDEVPTPPVQARCAAAVAALLGAWDPSR